VHVSALFIDSTATVFQVAVYCAYESTEDVYEIDEAALCSMKINLCGVKKSINRKLLCTTGD